MKYKIFTNTYNYLNKYAKINKKYSIYCFTLQAKYSILVYVNLSEGEKK